MSHMALRSYLRGALHYKCRLNHESTSAVAIDDTTRRGTGLFLQAASCESL